MRRYLRVASKTDVAETYVSVIIVRGQSAFNTFTSVIYTNRNELQLVEQNILLLPVQQFGRIYRVEARRFLVSLRLEYMKYIIINIDMYFYRLFTRLVSKHHFPPYWLRGEIKGIASRTVTRNFLYNNIHSIQFSGGLR